VFCTQEHIIIVLEYASEGSVAKYIWPEDAEKHRGLAMYLFQQLIAAVEYCHSKDIVYRDIELEKTLLTMEAQSDGQPFLALKVSDFGICHMVQDGELFSRVSTAFMAPVRLLNNSLSATSATWWL
jgi:serine/threonine protein kinase